MTIFEQIKECVTARQAAEHYGIKVKNNGMACCPFHSDRHPSMKIDKNYHCFACGVGGDAIDFIARLFGISQYEAAKKLIEDFGLDIKVEDRNRYKRTNQRRAGSFICSIRKLVRQCRTNLTCLILKKVRQRRTFL